MHYAPLLFTDFQLRARRRRKIWGIYVFLKENSKENMIFGRFRKGGARRRRKIFACGAKTSPDLSIIIRHHHIYIFRRFVKLFVWNHHIIWWFPTVLFRKLINYSRTFLVSPSGIVHNGEKSPNCSACGELKTHNFRMFLRSPLSETSKNHVFL